MASTVEVRVHVPVERETEFYRWFADWRDGIADTGPAAAATPDASGLESATAWWKSLTHTEAAIWNLWVEAAPSLISADQIVQELGLKGPRDIPGALAWSRRKGSRLGFKVVWRFDHDPRTGDPMYGLEDGDYAALIGQARDAVAQQALSPHGTPTGTRREEEA